MQAASSILKGERQGRLAEVAIEVKHMSEKIDLRNALLRTIAARDGIVIVGGRTMIKTEIARSVLQDFVAALFSDLRNGLRDILADDPSAKKKWLAELDASRRRIEKRIAARITP
jgi:hypothetical protein